MPLTRCPDDVSIEILKIAQLPLSAVSNIMLVQRAWNAFIHANEEHIYHNLAIYNGLTSARTTSLNEEKLAFGSKIPIQGWKTFCRWRAAMERNWAGLGPSSIARISATGNQVFYRKEIPGTDRVIISSTTGGISVYDGTSVVWALPTGYVEKPITFAYGNGYLAFRRTGQKAIEIWRDEAHPVGLISAAFPPTPEQEAATTTSLAAQFPSVHFRPSAALPAPIAPTEVIRLRYPTLAVATSSAVYTWDLQTGDSAQTLHTQKSPMNPVLGVEVSQELIVVFDREQVRFFSRSDGLFLFLLPADIPESGGVPRGVQLRPPATGGTPSQSSEAILLQQVLFRKRSKWSAPRGDIAAVGISECGNTLVVLSSKRRMFIVNDIKRVIEEDLPISSAAVDVKIGAHYKEIMFLAVTRDKIALATTTGILIMSLRPCAAEGGVTSPRPYGTVRFCRSGSGPSIQLRASFVGFKPQFTNQINVLEFSGTKLLFHCDPTTVVDVPDLSDETIEEVNDDDGFVLCSRLECGEQLTRCIHVGRRSLPTDLCPVSLYYSPGNRHPS
ncbi:hypothetical protein B0H16DRAFT_209666 [Mycena metata]|uniref:Uncharacterized protein n=1 Tax=Mycena metata TaxID=1033252 RepID=A0AAD7MT36_9AGAR|nr:hypothetical protein B0H16DRAFT_209666 [Mycena metata]